MARALDCALAKDPCTPETIDFIFIAWVSQLYQEEWLRKLLQTAWVNKDDELVFDFGEAGADDKKAATVGKIIAEFDERIPPALTGNSPRPPS